MTKLSANAKLVKNFRIDVDDGRAHAVCLDLEEQDGGTDLGPSALELALMSFAGCYATIFMLTAKKMRKDVNSLEVKAEAVKSEKAGTITETKFDITVDSAMPEDRVNRVHELTVKDCPVGKIFEMAGVRTTYHVASRKR